MKVVIDTNVWVSALVFGGNPRKVFEKIISQGYTIVYSEELLTEIRRTVRTKFPDFTGDLESLVVAFNPRLQKAELGTVNVNGSRDPKDDMVLETAVTENVDYIVSGDDDLLSLKSYRKMKIVNPAEFLIPE